MASKTLHEGDAVKWATPQGETRGKVVKKETSTTKASDHAAKATATKPQFRVRSDKTGKEAVHRPKALKPA